MDLTDKQWQVVRAVLPPDPVREDRRGRPWTDRRVVVNGILWVLRTNAAWSDLPARYGNYKTVHRRFRVWVREGLIDRVLVALAADLRERGGLDLRFEGETDPLSAFDSGELEGWTKGVGRGVRSWRAATAMALLSREGRDALLRWRGEGPETDRIAS